MKIMEQRIFYKKVSSIFYARAVIIVFTLCRVFSLYNVCQLLKKKYDFFTKNKILTVSENIL